MRRLGSSTLGSGIWFRGWGGGRSPDPLHVHASGGGEALNSYHYVSGSLLQASDPLGLSAQEGFQPTTAAGERQLDDTAVSMTASGLGHDVTITYQAGIYTRQIQLAKSNLRPLTAHQQLLVMNRGIV